MGARHLCLHLGFDHSVGERVMAFNPENWNWAMWAYMILCVLSLCGYFSLHGQTRTWNAGSGLLSIIIAWTLLYLAGAFA